MVWNKVGYGASLIVVTVMVAGLWGCDARRGDNEAATGRDDAPFRVAVVVPGSTADQGWNYSAKEAADRLSTELELSPPITFLESVESSQRQSVLRDLGRERYALVICHGYEFHQPVKEIAPDFPNTVFVISGYDQPDTHFGSIVYQLGEAAYLCGAVASVISETGHVGFIAAMPVPPVVLCYQGFRNGYMAYRPDGVVSDAVYIEGTRPWEDSAAAKVKTQALLRLRDPAPIDVLFQNADAASRGIFEAVEERDGSVFVFGANRNQNDSRATSRVIASAVIHVDRAFLRAAQEVREGTYKPHVASETVVSGVIECVPNPKLESMIGESKAAKVRGVLDQAHDAIVSGAIDPYE